jgi:ATP-dependent Clp protease ATP-binding subunit ClpX
MTSNVAPEPVIVCTFCGRPKDSVRKLVAGLSGYICDSCIATCNEILAEEEQPEPRVGAQ